MDVLEERLDPDVLVWRIESDIVPNILSANFQHFYSIDQVFIGRPASVR